jgi:phosphatidylethanolamine-binding protein (PEBP) family uncharacterized protein
METKVLTFYTDELKKKCTSAYSIHPSSLAKMIAEVDKHPNIVCVSVLDDKEDQVLFLSLEIVAEQERWLEIFQEAINGVRIKQPKLCDPFYNTIPLKVTYAYEKIKVDADDGVTLPTSYTLKKPIVSYKGSGRGLYTLILLNPDSPSSAYGIPNSDFVHWVVVNIPDNDVNAGQEVLKYIGACPYYNAGPQRYFFLLYRQDKVMQSQQILEAESYFNSRWGLYACNWAFKQGFGLPVGVNGFTSEWSEDCDKIHQIAKFIPQIEFQSPFQKASVDIYLFIFFCTINYLIIWYYLILGCCRP